MPMPPCIWMVSLPTRMKASDSRALAIDARRATCASLAGIDGRARGHHDRTRQVGFDEHARGAVLERLEAPDQFAELLACLQVVERHLEGRAEAAQHLGSEGDRGTVDDAREQAAAFAQGAEHRVRPHVDATEMDERTATAVDAVLALDRHAARGARHEEQRHAARVARGTRGAGRHDEAVGDVTVEHRDLLAAQAESRSGALGPRLDVREVEATARLVGRQRQQAIPAATAGRCACF